LARRDAPAAYPSLFESCFEKRTDGEGAGASIEASARNPGIIRANAARYRPRLAQLS
jgi:hypothetical protein